MAALAPHIGDLYGSEEFSDVDILIIEETQGNAGGKRKRAAADESTEQAVRKKELHGHRVVLYGFSTYCKTKLSNWSSSSSAGKPEILITVPAGQLEAGELLLKAMYAATPNLSACSQAQLLQLLLLADRYGVSKVLQAVIAAFSSIPTADLQWDTVMAVYNLPPGCADLDACKGVITAAGQKLQQVLGDLELVWAGKQGQKQQQLLQLPHRALLQLLQDPPTRVSSENTVFYTIDRWQQQQFPELLSCSTPDEVQLLKELVRHIRMQNCTQLYVATVMSRSHLASLCFSPAELIAATSYSSTGGEARGHIAALRVGCPEVARYPAWSLPQRPASAMTQLTMEWQLPLQQLKELVEQHLQDTAEVLFKSGERHVWQGQALRLEVGLNTTSEGAGKVSQLGLYVGTPDLPAGAVRRITFKVTASTAGGGASQNNITRGPSTQNFGGETRSWGLKGIASSPGLTSWSQAEAKLRELHLVHPDGCLHLKGEVIRML